VNAGEFQVWLSAHFAAFPDTQKWISNTDQPADTIKVWAKVLSETDGAAAIEVTERMARGDIEPPPAYERERTAAVVRREAGKIHFALQSRKQHDYEGVRFDCKICQDAGSVTVWAYRSVKYAREHGKVPMGRYVEAVACTCQRGSGLATERSDGSYKWSALPRFDKNKHCRVTSGMPNKDDCEKLLDWIEMGQTTRHAQFDEWNEGA
jgi:hypothetical protein